LAETIDENTSIQESRNRITDILKEYGKGKKSVLEKMIENIESFLPLEKGMFIKFILKNYLNTFYNIEPTHKLKKSYIKQIKICNILFAI